MKLTLLFDRVELAHNTTNENTFKVWYNKTEKTFICHENNGTRSFKYKLSDTIENIIKNYRHEILTYVLGRYTKHDKVGIGDIFMYGKFLISII
jgi:hypothetical protein